MRTARSRRVLSGGVPGVETYTRMSLYVIAGLELLVILPAMATIAEDSTPLALLIAALAFTHAALCVVTMRLGFDGRPVGEPATRAVLVALGACAAAMIGLALAALPAGGVAWYVENPRASVIVLVGVFTLAALSVRLDIRALALASVGAVAIAAIGQLASPEPELTPVLVVATLPVVLGFVASTRLSIWILEVVRELDASRGTAARLAVAEERLRISRDMHDVVGRALSTVAVKSELAAELARRGGPRAVDEMLEVRALAQESLRDVRGVVAGYRSADLATELAGARSVLGAAGIRTRIIGEASGLDAGAQEALAWVVREAVTNVVRHADATRCTLELVSDDASTLLRIVNDGVRGAGDAAASGTPGSGLRGLAERLAGGGGSVTAARDGDRFVLEARVANVVSGSGAPWAESGTVRP